ncbi:TPA: tryptophan--tRNA ligase [archaeon]|uniref:Tryptophan--tRNA ligase n=1 Tax=Candidatus Naiadarchaeum limnaeum TaxID=2756139 RepID=A0A832XJ25_9ARCH|nr:tryptophan--tRNA ligase [Candidatus Naiadarchaeales archaeon SRR2090153.bin1042]HIK00007.1 tryptophan--tRNA ligase [Candidatus Naiadarchaeum limnaeum]
MAQEFKVTPWEVSGIVDYDKLMKEFGTQPLTDSLLERVKKFAKGDLHYLFRRKIFFSHRDFDWILNEYEKGNKFFLYTGRAPSGHTHLGHLIPWIITKWLQDNFNAELYFQMSDDEKFYFKEELTLDDTTRLTKENMLDIIALGFDQKKTHFIINTQHAKIMYREAAKVAKKLTVSTAKAVFGLSDRNNIGEFFYTCMQSVPAFLPSILKGKNIPCLIPLAIDQDPHFRIARDIIPKLGYYKPSILHCKFLPALTGPDSKMSASEEQTAVYTTDTPETVEKKIKKYAFSGGRDTVEEHRKLGGNPAIDVSYQWLTFFEEDDKKLKRIYEDYKSGKMLTGELKEILIQKLTKFLKEHQRNREKAKKVLNKFILKD